MIVEFVEEMETLVKIVVVVLVEVSYSFADNSRILSFKFYYIIGQN